MSNYNTRYSLSFTADVNQAKKEIQSLRDSLNSLSTNKNTKGETMFKNLTPAIQQAQKAAAQLQISLEHAVNVDTGKLNLNKFNQSLKQSGMTLQGYANQLKTLGPTGEQAFMGMARAIVSADSQLITLQGSFKKLAVSLANTARWQISSSILQGFMRSISTAWNYAQDLNESLNNIRIVTGYNTEYMADFAKEANKAAKALHTTTTAYTDASLIYFQQGLSSQEVKERADVTIKLANVSRQSAEVVSDQMTAVWNNFYDGSKSLEYYADILTQLGAATASSTEEISAGLEKFAAAAETVGLSYEYATSALATVTATTRESAEVVGNSFKTLFSRLQGLQLGETLDDGTTLNKYSSALNAVGINIKDVNGQIKDMDSILDELGGKWNNLGKDQQIALAQTVAGVRQYTQLIALMDNWDYFQENLSTAQNSTGALQEQADIYAESWEAASNKVKASAETIYSALINDEFFIELTNGFSKFLDTLKTVIDSMGGLKGVLMSVGSIIVQVFSQQITQRIQQMALGIKNLLPGAQAQAQALRSQATEQMATFAQQQTPGDAGRIRGDSIRQEANIYDALINKRRYLTEEEKKIYDLRLKNYQVLVDENIKQAEAARLARQKAEFVKSSDIYVAGDKTDSVVYQQAQAELEVEATGKQDYKDAMEWYNNTSGSTRGEKPKVEDYITSDEIAARAQQIQEKRYKSLDKVAAKSEADVYTKKANAIKDNVIQETKNPNNDPKIAQANAKALKEQAQAALDVVKGMEKIDDLSQDQKDNLARQEGILKGIIDQNGYVEKGNESIKATMEAVKQVGQKIAENSNIELKNLSVLTDEEERYLELKRQEAEATGQQNLGEGEGKRSGEGLEKDINDKKPGMTAVLTDASAAIMSVGAAISAVQGMVDVFNNPDATMWEKLVSVLTLATTAMTVYTGVSKFAQTLEQQGILVRVADTLSRMINKKATDAQTNAEKQKVMWQILSNTYMLIAIAIIAILAVAIMGIIKLVEHLTDVYNADAIAAQEAAENAQALAEQYDNCKQSYEEMIAAMEEYETAKQGLEELTKGTEEYYQALQEANRAAKELLASSDGFTKDDYYWENGQLIIKDEALDRVKSQEAQRVSDAALAADLGTIAAQQAATKSDITDFQRSSRKGTGFDNASNVWRTIGTNLLGVGSGLIGTLVGGYLTAEGFNNANDYKEAVNTLIDASAQDSSLLAGDKNAFITAIEQAGLNIDTSNDKLIDALYNNKDSLEELSNQVKRQIEEADLAYQQNAIEQLIAAGKDIESQSGAAAAEASGAILKALTSEAISNREGQDVSSMWDAYVNVAGLGDVEFRKVKTKKDRVEYTYMDGDQEVTGTATKAMIVNTLAAADAADRLTGAFERLQLQLMGLMNSEDAGQRAYGEFLTNQSLAGSSQEEIIDLKEDVNAAGGIEKYLKSQGLNDETAVEQGFKDFADAVAVFSKALEINVENTTGTDVSGASAKDITTLSNNRKNLEQRGDDAATAYTEILSLISSASENLDPNTLKALWADVAQVSMEDYDAEEQLLAITQEYGAEIDSSSEKWRNSIQAIDEVVGAVQDVKTLADTINNINKLSSELSVGSIIEPDDYQRLVAYNRELAQYFTMLADGNYKLNQDILDFQQEINQTTIDTWENAREEAADEIAQIQSQLNEIEANFPALSQQAAYYYDERISKSKKKAFVPGGLTQWASFDESVLKDQLSYLIDTLGVTSAGGYNLQEVQAAINDRSGFNGWQPKYTSNNPNASIEDYQYINHNGIGVISAKELSAVVSDALQNNLSSAEQTELKNQSMVEELTSELISAQATYTQAGVELMRTAKTAEERQALVEESPDLMTASQIVAKEEMTATDWEGLDVEEVAEYAEFLEEVMDLEEESAEELARVSKKAELGLESLSENWEEWYDLLDRGNKDLSGSVKQTEEYMKALKSTKTAVSQLLDISEDFIDSDFISDPDNLELIGEAAEGSSEAITKLGLALANDMLIDNTEWIKNYSEDLGESLTEAENKVRTFMDEISNAINNQEFSLGEVVTSDALSSLNKFVEASGMSVEQANAFYRSLGFTPQFEMVDATSTDASIPVTTTLHRITSKTPQYFTYADGRRELIGYDWDEQEYSYTSQMDGGQFQQTFPSFSVTTADGKSAPLQVPSTKVSKLTYTGGGGNSTKVGKSPSGKSSGGGGSKKKKDKNDEIDRYHEIKQEIEDIERSYDRLADNRERAFGPDKFEWLDLETAKLEENIDAQERYLKEAQAYLANDKATVQAIGAIIDEDTGRILNYTALMSQWVDEFNSGKLSEEQYDLNQKILDRYEETLNETEDIVETIRDQINELIDLKIEKIQIQLEFEIGLVDDDLSLINYQLGKLEDKAFSAASALGLLASSYEASMAKGQSNITAIMSILGVNNLDDYEVKGEMTQAEADALREYRDGVIEAADAIRQLAEDAVAKVTDEFEQWNEEIDKNLEKFDHYKTVLETFQNISDITGTSMLGITREIEQGLNQAIMSNALNNVEATHKNVERLRAAEMEAEKRYLEATTEEEKEMWKEIWDNITEETKSATEDLLSAWEESVQAAADIFQKTVENVIEDFEKNLTGAFGKSLEEFRQTYDQQTEASDRYVDDYKKIYELSKLNRDIQKSIDDNDSVKSKQQLRDLQKQINDMQASGNKLSQYDLDHARAKYDLLVAEIALRDAQNAKSQVRLRRDTEGNYSYVFTADQDSMLEAQQSYEDKLYALQELNTQYIEEMEQMMLQSYEEFTEAVANLDITAFASMDEYLAAVEELRVYYLGKAEYYAQEQSKALGNNKQLYNEDWMTYSQATGYKISKDEEFRDKFNETIQSQLTGYETVQEAMESFRQATEDMVGSPGADGQSGTGLAGAFESWASSVEDAMRRVGLAMEGGEGDNPLVLVGKEIIDIIEGTEGQKGIVDASDEAVEAVDNLAQAFNEKFNDKLLNDFADWVQDYVENTLPIITAFENIISKINELIQKEAEYRNQLKEPYEVGKQETQGTVGNTVAEPSDSGNGDKGGNGSAVEKWGQGWSKEKIKVLQSFLNVKNNNTSYPDISVDGSFGPASIRLAKNLNYANLTQVQSGYITWAGGPSSEGAKRYYSYDTGGYTGSWGPEGRLAMLHQKELVLNADDTTNMLKSVELLRDISRVIDLNAGSQANLLGQLGTYVNTNSASTIEQQITIYADFPEANDRFEIEEAFRNLTLHASQFANRKKI